MKQTKQWRTPPEGEKWDPAAENAIREAAELLRGGGTVAFPTETVYGLGADARNTSAVERVFEAKGRPSDNPLIVHIADLGQLGELVLPFGETAARLMERFWPGPLTLVLPVRPGAVSPRVTAGLDTVAVRMPANETALRLIAAAGCPIAAPSANRSGRPSPTRAEHVADDLNGLIDGLVDGGPTGVGLESTVVELVHSGTDRSGSAADPRSTAVRILRPGGVTPEDLRAVIAHVIVDASSDARAARPPQAGPANADPAAGAAPGPAPRSPGMKYAHYAPRGEMTLVQGSIGAVASRIRAEAAAARSLGQRTGVLTFAEHRNVYAGAADVVIAAGSLAQLEEAAHELYEALRAFDNQGAQRIWAEGCPESGIGLAVMNRLRKAAGGRIIEV